MQIKKEFTPTVRQTAQMALFFAALLVVGFSISPFAGAVWLWFAVDWYYSGATLALYILCARVTGYRFAVLILGICNGLLSIAFMAYGGPIMVLYSFLPPLLLQVVFLLSHTNGEDLKFDLAGSALYGIVAGCTFFFLLVGVVEMEFPSWLIWPRILSITVTSAFGGFLGWRIGKRLARRA